MDLNCSHKEDNITFIKGDITEKKLNLNEEFDIFQGEFIKSILKINNMVNELSKVAEYLQNIPLLDKLKKIPELILKFTATNQSLYV